MRCKGKPQSRAESWQEAWPSGITSDESLHSPPFIFWDPTFYSRCPGNHGSAFCGRLGLGANFGRRCLWRVSLSPHLNLLLHLLERVCSATVSMWRHQDNVWELVLIRVRRTELSSSLTAGGFTCLAVLKASVI